MRTFTKNAELQRMIRTLEKLGEMGTTVAPECAKAVHAVLVQTIADGTEPDGTPWKPRIKDGQKPLRNAAKELRVEADGAKIVISLSGIEAKHHLGAVRGKTKRRIIPSKSKLPPKIAAALHDTIAKHFKAIAAGGK